MFLVGVICDENSQKWVKSTIEKNKEASVIVIQEENIENIKNITLDTILIMRKVIYSQTLQILLKKANYIIMNTDVKENLQLLEESKKALTVITYGFNSKATVTASSVTEDSMIICVQRNILTKQATIFEAQEMQIPLDGKKVLDIMGVYTFFIVHEIIK